MGLTAVDVVLCMMAGHRTISLPHTRHKEPTGQHKLTVGVVLVESWLDVPDGTSIATTPHDEYGVKFHNEPSSNLTHSLPCWYMSTRQK